MLRSSFIASRTRESSASVGSSGARSKTRNLAASVSRRTLQMRARSSELRRKTHGFKLLNTRMRDMSSDAHLRGREASSQAHLFQRAGLTSMNASLHFKMEVITSSVSAIRTTSEREPRLETNPTYPWPGSVLREAADPQKASDGNLAGPTASAIAS